MLVSRQFKFREFCFHSFQTHGDFIADRSNCTHAIANRKYAIELRGKRIYESEMSVNVIKLCNSFEEQMGDEINSSRIT